MKTKMQNTSSIIRVGKRRNKPKIYSRVGNDFSGDNSGYGACKSRAIRVTLPCEEGRRRHKYC